MGFVEHIAWRKMRSKQSQVKVLSVLVVKSHFTSVAVRMLQVFAKAACLMILETNFDDIVV